jgi:ATP-dependent DNA helicase RecQ
MPDPADLKGILRQCWGYDSFRPLQEGIINSLLGGHDTCVVMPTGGGKSLCYQLPAVLLNQTVVVISPLIALMQDQATQLGQMGIPAAVLNSSQPANEQATVMRKARAGEYRLLYLSPERLARPDTMGWLRGVPLAFFAIDEAHCISEWGHEFRPEYRQLSCLRTSFPDKPIAALTASATRRVRHDILNQLHLVDPHKYIASFHRGNLRYVVKLCEPKTQLSLLVRAIRHYGDGNIIVYVPTIARVDETVDFLAECGTAAVPYHGQMEPEARRGNQERWMSDECRVLVGTIAFGLGINKAAVRAVIHLSLPKSIEQYYQEAGRAGRDGLPADCVLLWQTRDSGLLAYFAGQIQDPAERERAWERYRIIKDFAESKECRHKRICRHFGETTKWERCDACDACGYEVPWLSAPARLKPIESRSDGRSSRRLSPDVDTARPAAWAFGDPELREYLREWRRNTARQLNVPAYVVMYDTSLEEICQKPPASVEELRHITGFGERKTSVYGEQILAALRQFREGARAAPTPDKKPSPAEETKRLLSEGKTFDQIASARGRQLRTVIGSVANLIEQGEVEFQSAWMSPEKQAVIEAACAKIGLQWLKPIKDSLPEDISYEEIRLVVARLRRLLALSRAAEEPKAATA